jgi:hypothetical protein
VCRALKRFENPDELRWTNCPLSIGMLELDEFGPFSRAPYEILAVPLNVDQVGVELFRANRAALKRYRRGAK